MTKTASKPNFPWAPTGTSTFNRVVGQGYGAGGVGVRMTGKGAAAGTFKKGPFRLGR